MLAARERNFVAIRCHTLRTSGLGSRSASRHSNTYSGLSSSSSAIRVTNLRSMVVRWCRQLATVFSAAGSSFANPYQLVLCRARTRSRRSLDVSSRMGTTPTGPVPNVTV